MAGFIKLHREFLKWEWYHDTNVARLFLHLLLSASYETNKWQGKIIKKGQLVTGRLKLASELNLSEMQIRTALNKLKTTNEITINPHSQYSIITVNNWTKWQDINQQNNQQVTNEQPTDSQRVTTTKEGKEVKEGKNIFTLGEFKNVLLSETELSKLKEIYSNKFDEAIEKLSSYIAGKGVKYKSHYAVLGKHNWVYRDIVGAKKEDFSNGYDY